ncbi:YCF48-related protein [Pseudomonas sp. TH10]|uniref:WD40/YVTN/BNR-like repeat-containing protein n=1 Tax=Pseudomonas sp. TH10 TaxID=2796376 RepID=UPI0019131F25|nr:YCF48-related protein [Pseudomonas sp. TH10]MBK5518311.1 photosystem II stability/assembly factor-like protein [Pseudomonas sp. TH10]
MNKNKCALASLLCVSLIAGLVLTASAGSRNVADTLEQTATVSALANRFAFNAAAMAGERLVVAGMRGTILYSDDQGQQWRQASVPVSVSLTGICFADAANGWAVGHRGVILATRDGGAHWTRQLDGVQVAQSILHVRQDPERIDEARRLVAEGADKPFLTVQCMGDGRVLALGAYGLAFSTKNAGQSWQPALALLDGSDSLHLNAVQVLGGRVYVAGEQGALLRVNNDLQGFTRFASPYEGSFFGLLATRNNSLLAVGLRGHVLRSVDQGSSWQPVNLASTKSLTAATELRDGSLLLADESGQGWLSRDDGRSFRAVLPEERFPLIALLALSDGGSLAVGTHGITRFLPSALR